MNLFLIAIDNDNDPDKVHENVSQKYPEKHFRLSELTWIVASEATSSAEIRQNFGMDSKTLVTGVVVPFHDYSGYASTDLWRLAADWSQA